MKTPISLTQQFFNRAVQDFKRITKEEISVRFFSNAFWIFGSELAVLRLAVKYRTFEDHGFSEAYNSWYFRLDTPHIEGEMQ